MPALLKNVITPHPRIISDLGVGNWPTESYDFSFSHVVNTNVYQSGTSNPLWKRLVYLKQDATSAYTRWASSLKVDEKGFVNLSYTFNFNDGSGIHSGFTNVFGSIAMTILGDQTGPAIIELSPEARVQLNLKLLEKVRTSYTKWDSSVFLGEIGETVRLLRNPVKSMTQAFSSYLRDVKKLRPSFPKSWKRRRKLQFLNEAVQGMYLTTVFGVQPLIRDASDAQAALVELLDTKMGRLERVSATVHERRIVHGTGTKTIRGVFSFPYHTVVEQDISGRMYGYIKHGNASNCPREDFGVTFGGQLRDFIPTVWNLLPFSFVADYVTNIGDVLNAIGTNTQNLVVLGLTTRTRGTSTVEMTFDPGPVLAALAGPPFLSVQAAGLGGRCIFEGFQLTREKLDKDSDLFFWPLLNIPSFRQTINLVSLAASSRAASDSLKSFVY